MPKITRDQVKVPADVLADVRETYVDNHIEGNQARAVSCCSRATTRRLST